MKNKKQAFTLAEVLLVLAIIGVIAAVTIPAVMQQSSEKKFAALAKKMQSTLQNAIDLKIATVPIGPGDMGVGLFQWLIDGEEDGTNTLKVAKVNSNTNASVIQTTDGMIFYVTVGATCSTASTPTKKLGCRSSVYVDLNGSEGPTKTTVDNLADLKTTDTGKAYDVIYVNVTEEGYIKPGVTVSTGGYSLTKRAARAKKYLLSS